MTKNQNNSRIPGEAPIEVIAPADIRRYEPVPLEGESPRRYEFRKRLFEAILDEGDYKTDTARMEDLDELVAEAQKLNLGY